MCETMAIIDGMKVPLFTINQARIEQKVCLISDDMDWVAMLLANASLKQADRQAGVSVICGAYSRIFPHILPISVFRICGSHIS
jgi:hypothetical protein